MVQSLEFRKKSDDTDVTNHRKFEGFDLKSGPKPFLKCSRDQTFCFFVEQNSMDSSYWLWNKSQNYQVRYILTDHFLVRKRFDSLTPSFKSHFLLESFSLQNLLKF